MPTFENEILGWKKGSHVVGIDEVGKGALAGPMTLTAVLFAKDNSPDILTSLIKSGIDDSKLLSPKKRKMLYYVLQKTGCAHFTTSVSPSQIDAMGISHAWNHCFSKLITKVRQNISDDAVTVLVDGLPIHDLRYDNNTVLQFITKGDRASVSIAAASIVAKVLRDEYMIHQSPRYPAFQFHQNKGYGTKVHMNALKTVGPTPLHRISFIDHIIPSPIHT